mgnify:CR=1 FL=1|tara:strand:+ start:5794 stop:6036 length:243 start_codon:yes stop_codon:yes gene_type:complete
MNWKLATIKAGAVLLPTYTVAIITEKMVYTMPMLAAATIFVTALSFEDLFSKKNDTEMKDESTMKDPTEGISKEVDIEGE